MERQMKKLEEDVVRSSPSRMVETLLSSFVPRIFLLTADFNVPVASMS